MKICITYIICFRSHFFFLPSRFVIELSWRSVHFREMLFEFLRCYLDPILDRISNPLWFLFCPDLPRRFLIRRDWWPIKMLAHPLWPLFSRFLTAPNVVVHWLGFRWMAHQTCNISGQFWVFLKNSCRRGFSYQVYCDILWQIIWIDNPSFYPKEVYPFSDIT